MAGGPRRRPPAKPIIPAGWPMFSWTGSVIAAGSTSLTVSYGLWEKGLGNTARYFVAVQPKHHGRGNPVLCRRVLRHRRDRGTEADAADTTCDTDADSQASCSVGRDGVFVLIAGRAHPLLGGIRRGNPVRLVSLAAAAALALTAGACATPSAEKSSAEGRAAAPAKAEGEEGKRRSLVATVPVQSRHGCQTGNRSRNETGWGAFQRQGRCLRSLSQERCPIVRPDETHQGQALTPDSSPGPVNAISREKLQARMATSGPFSVRNRLFSVRNRLSVQGQPLRQAQDRPFDTPRPSIRPGLNPGLLRVRVRCNRGWG